MHNPADILQNAFDSFVAKLTERDDFVLPKRQFILTGEVVYDGPQFCVHTMSGPYQGSPGQPMPMYSIPTGGLVQFSMDFGVTVVRSFPVMDDGGRPPLGSQLTTASLEVANDAAALTETFYAAAEDNTILGPYDTLYWSGVSFQGPFGDTIGVRLTFGAQL